MGIRLQAATDQHAAMTEDLEDLAQSDPASFTMDQVWVLIRAIKVQSQILQLYVGQAPWTSDDPRLPAAFRWTAARLPSAGRSLESVQSPAAVDGPDGRVLLQPDRTRSLARSRWSSSVISACASVNGVRYASFRSITRTMCRPLIVLEDRAELPTGRPKIAWSSVFDTRLPWVVQSRLRPGRP